MDRLRAWPKHIHELHQCSAGARAFAERLGLDYSEFVFHGTPVEQLLATGDAFAARLAQHVIEEAARGSEQ